MLNYRTESVQQDLFSKVDFSEIVRLTRLCKPAVMQMENPRMALHREVPDPS